MTPAARRRPSRPGSPRSRAPRPSASDVRPACRRTLATTRPADADAADAALRIASGSSSRSCASSSATGKIRKAPRLALRPAAPDVHDLDLARPPPSAPRRRLGRTAGQRQEHQAAGEGVQRLERRPGLGVLDLQGQQPGRPRQQGQRILAPEEASGVGRVAQGRPDAPAGWRARSASTQSARSGLARRAWERSRRESAAPPRRRPRRPRRAPRRRPAMASSHCSTWSRQVRQSPISAGVTGSLPARTDDSTSSAACRARPIASKSTIPAAPFRVWNARNALSSRSGSPGLPSRVRRSSVACSTSSRHSMRNCSMNSFMQRPRTASLHTPRASRGSAA